MYGILLYLVIGLIVGWLASMLVKGSGLSVLGAIVVGIVGAEIGGWLARAVGFGGEGETLRSLVMSVIGAVVLLLIIRLIKRRRGRIG